MPLGKWGKALQNSDFNEVCYLGDYPVFMIWCNEKKYDFCDPSIEEKFTGLPVAEKDKLRDTFGNQIMGNCGELANWKGYTPTSHGSPRFRAAKKVYK